MIVVHESESSEAGNQASEADSVEATIAWLSAIGGLLAYNWWVLVPLKPGLLRSPDEFFSNLEVAGQPYATVMQHLDVLSGLLILAAFAMAGFAAYATATGSGSAYRLRDRRADRRPVSAGLRGRGQRRLHGRRAAFPVPLTQYVHDGAGIVEFVGITLALLLAVRRTSSQRTATASTYRALAIGAAVMYPVLGLTYMINKLGAVIEGVFFAGFAVMVVVQIHERLARGDCRPTTTKA